MEAARSQGLRLPEDLSIVGFDDTAAAAWTSPQLTTVRQPMREMGRVALRSLLAAARGERPDTHHFELATRLVVRSSTASVRGDGSDALTAGVTTDGTVPPTDPAGGRRAANRARLGA